MPSVQVPLLSVPPSLATTSNKSGLYKMLVSAALGAGKQPKRLHADGLTRSAVFIPDILHAKIAAAATKANMSFQDAFLGLTAEGIALKQVQRQDLNARVMDAAPPPFRGARPGQIQFYRQALASLSAGRVALAEASTGSGKARAMVSVAIEQASAGKAPVVIAAPTLQVLNQLWQELEILRAEGIGTAVKCAFFPGITEFADAEKIEAYLGVAENPDTAVQEWFARGGPSLHETPLIRAMRAQAAGVNLSFMMEDLRNIATNVDVRQFAQEDKEDDLVDKVRAYAADAGIIFCTHAMLARSHQTKWKAIPEPAVLIIDEAHEFERNVASVHSDQLSLHALIWHLREHAGAANASSVAGKAIKATRSLIAAIRSADLADGGGSRDDAPLGTGTSSAVREAIVDLRNAIKSKSLVPAGANARHAVVRARAILDLSLDIIEGREKSRGYIQFSPDRRYPSFVVGRASIGAILGDIWNAAKGGTLLASATLYIPDEFGNSKADYIADVLSLPQSRTDAHPPIIEPWVLGVPTMHTPAPSMAAVLARPLSKDRNADNESAWLGRLAQAISEITKDAAGGTLVLLSSYAQAEAVGQQLALPQRTVIQLPSEKFSTAQVRYKKMFEAGLKPILLGVGSAWTGVNLVDERKRDKPEEDFMLTDLVIGCCPIGLNKTPTMKTRIDRQGVAGPTSKEALMLLRQGLGRLMRDKDFKARHIWILDGRIWQDWPGMSQFTKPAQYIVRAYPNQKRIAFPF